MSGASGVFEVVHNIPSPYRLHLFSVMAEALTERGYQLVVNFMAASHVDRSYWTATELDVSWRYKFWPDYGPSLNGKKWHLNPGLISHLMRNPPDYLVIGGPWDSLTGVLTSVLNRSPVSIGWFEGNTSTPGVGAGRLRLIKKGLLRRHTFLAVPGKEGAKLARAILGGDTDTRIAILPNIVDESRFSRKQQDRGSTRSSLGIANDERMILWPARLIAVKGIEPFLCAVTPENLGRARVVILGDGPLRERVQQVISERRLCAHVTVHSACAYDLMPAIYHAADVFLLPSLYDSNPLSVVEAMHAGLPIVVSNRVGNFPEALQEGINGWSIDPTSPENTRRVMGRVVGTSTETLRVMGQQSVKIARAFWASRPAVDGFIDCIMRPA